MFVIINIKIIMQQIDVLLSEDKKQDFIGVFHEGHSAVYRLFNIGFKFECVGIDHKVRRPECFVLGVYVCLGLWLGLYHDDTAFVITLIDS
jgi:hypothetical protein